MRNDMLSKSERRAAFPRQSDLTRPLVTPCCRKPSARGTTRWRENELGGLFARRAAARRLKCRVASLFVYGPCREEDCRKRARQEGPRILFSRSSWRAHPSCRAEHPPASSPPSSASGTLDVPRCPSTDAEVLSELRGVGRRPPNSERRLHPAKLLRLGIHGIWGGVRLQDCARQTPRQVGVELCDSTRRQQRSWVLPHPIPPRSAVTLCCRRVEPPKRPPLCRGCRPAPWNQSPIADEARECHDRIRALCRWDRCFGQSEATAKLLRAQIWPKAGFSGMARAETDPATAASVRGRCASCDGGVVHSVVQLGSNARPLRMAREGEPNL